MWIDTHCHLNIVEGATDQIVDAARCGVDRLVVVGTNVVDSVAAIELAAQVPGVFPTAGVHPHDASQGIDGLAELLGDPSVVAVGECGLDFHYMNSPAEDQRRVFADQLALASEHDLAVVVHTRDAWADTVDILSAATLDVPVVIHCFSGGPAEARPLLDLGAYLSFSGIVTFPSAAEVREAANLCPLDRILVETDSPFLAPVPHRGRPNNPSLVAIVGESVAQLRGIASTDLAAAVAANAAAVFGWGDHAERLPAPVAR